jgi:hypothetical protein
MLGVYLGMIMTNKSKKRFFANHAKSSAMVVSLAIHAVLIVVALSFVAVTVIKKEDQNFEAKQVARPKMPIKKLQVPVKVNRKKPKPKLRKNITVKTKMDRKMPEIRMPEIAGVKGGIGSIGDGGLGGSGGVGFSMPEIEVFGVKSKGEKVFLILDSSPEIMYDEMGGITAYTIIKDELVKIIGGLGPTTLFNIAVYDRGRTSVLFPQMVSASAANVAKTKAWLDPLNIVSPGMADDAFGLKTLGPGGQEIANDLLVDPIQFDRLWVRPALMTMKQQADAVFVLASVWGHQRHEIKARKEWNPAKRQRWDEAYQEGLKLLKQENEERKKNGQPPRVLVGIWDVNRAYFPDIERPPAPEWYYYTPRDITEAMVEVRKQWMPAAVPLASGIKKPKKDTYTFNVIHFLREDGNLDDTGDGRYSGMFEKMASLSKGQYRTLTGLEAIRSSVSGASSD